MRLDWLGESGGGDGHVLWSTARATCRAADTATCVVVVAIFQASPELLFSYRNLVIPVQSPRPRLRPKEVEEHGVIDLLNAATKRIQHKEDRWWNLAFDIQTLSALIVRGVEPGITWTYFGVYKGPHSPVVSLRVCSGPQQTRSFSSELTTKRKFQHRHTVCHHSQI